jgi:PhnB protein
MMQLSPYITVENVKEAIDYYQSAFGGEVKILNKAKDNILHAELHVSTAVILHLSSNYGKTYSNENKDIILTFDDLATQEQVYNALSVEGNPQMPLEKTFFNAMHGQVKDKYGVNWLMNCFLK